MQGLGVDVIEIDRIERAVERWGDRFLQRIFTEDEIRYCHVRRRPGPSLAARFAAKEAFAKAVAAGTDPGWHEVEVAIDAAGKPRIQLAPRLAAALGDCQVHVSLSHSATVAVAVVVIA
jgi:holo-[acyl-carrier protein] synthase